MILAGIDIGTNTLRLLVAETGPESFHEIFSDRRITRLGQGLDRTGALSDEAEERSLDALFYFSESIRRYGALAVSAVGTSALRKASNSAAYLELVKKKTGLAVEIISGEEEARLTLLGVEQALQECGRRTDARRVPALVIDIGGGSTELIRTHPGREPALTVSLPLGAVYLTERFLKTDPPSPEGRERLRREVLDVLQQQGDGISPDAGGLLIGTAGTITTLASMDLGLARYEASKINCHSMTRETIEGIGRRLASSTLGERRAMPGLEQGREDIIFAGAMIIQEIMRYFKFTSLVVSDWGLREGIVFDLYDRISAGG